MARVTDNFKDFPARMSDGRAFTQYQANCLLNTTISSGLDSYQFRQKLITETDNILENQRKLLGDKFLCSTCNKATIPSEMFVQSCDNGNCYIDKISNEGVGIRQK